MPVFCAIVEILRKKACLSSGLSTPEALRMGASSRALFIGPRNLVRISTNFVVRAPSPAPEREAPYSGLCVSAVKAGKAERKLHQHFRHFHLALTKCGYKRLHHLRVKIAACPFYDDLFGVERRHRLAVRPVAGQRIVHIRYRQNTRFQRDVLPLRRVVPGRTCRGAPG
jgi:hypothetical protein